MSLNREEPGDVFEGIAQIHVELLELELAGFHFREVQNVIDDGEQGGAAVADGFGVVALQGIKLRVEQEFGHAEHAVHRRADLVAHVGEELALCTVGRFCNLEIIDQLTARFIDALHHAIELSGQDRDFIATGQVQTRREIRAFAERHSMTGHAAERCEHDAIQNDHQ